MVSDWKSEIVKSPPQGGCAQLWGVEESQSRPAAPVSHVEPFEGVCASGLDTSWVTSHDHKS